MWVPLLGEIPSPAFRSSQRPRPRGRNTVTIAYNFSPRSLTTPFWSRLKGGDTASRICVPRLSAAIATLYRQRRTFSRYDATLPVPIDNCGMSDVAWKLIRYILERWNAIVYARRDFLHRASSWRCNNGNIRFCFSISRAIRDVAIRRRSRCGVKLELPRLKGPSGPLYNGHERNARPVNRLTSTVSSVTCVPSPSIGRRRV